MASAGSENMYMAKNIGEFGRRVIIGLACHNRCVQIKRYYTEEEMSRKTDDVTYTKIALHRDAIVKLLSNKMDIEDKLEQLDMGANIVEDRHDVGFSNYVVFDSNVSVVHLRRYFTLGDGELLPSKTGVCIKVEEMYNLLSELETMLPMVEKSL